jgi:hypothetical protein
VPNEKILALVLAHFAGAVCFDAALSSVDRRACMVVDRP